MLFAFDMVKTFPRAPKTKTKAALGVFRRLVRTSTFFGPVFGALGTGKQRPSIPLRKVIGLLVRLTITKNTQNTKKQP